MFTGSYCLRVHVRTYLYTMNLCVQMAYAQENDISEKMASIIMMVLGASTAAGRILFGRILQKGYLDRLRMDQLTMVISGGSKFT